MAASNQDLKNFFALSGNNPTMTNAKLTKLAAWLTLKKTAPVSATADDVVDHLYEYLDQQVRSDLKNKTVTTW